MPDLTDERIAELKQWCNPESDLFAIILRLERAEAKLAIKGIKHSWKCRYCKAQSMPFDDGDTRDADFETHIAGCDKGPFVYIKALEAERDAMKAVVEKLPVTADGVPIVPGMWLHTPTGDEKCPVFATTEQFLSPELGRFLEGIYAFNPNTGKRQLWYSTREAAIAAKSGWGVT